MIFIPGNTPSLKNSKVKTSRGIFQSKTVTKYIRAIGIQSFSSSKKIIKEYVDASRPNLFEKEKPGFDLMLKGKEFPLVIGFHQVRNSKRKFDFGNSVEILQDLMTASDWIEDDNVSFMFPVPMYKDGTLIDPSNPRKEPLYSVDKDNPGCYVKVF
tara:strand:- start:377 stop:844 length:468 start_codon:yes stop_codon:yes gene_type:complete